MSAKRVFQAMIGIALARVREYAMLGRRTVMGLGAARMPSRRKTTLPQLMHRQAYGLTAGLVLTLLLAAAQPAGAVWGPPGTGALFGTTADATHQYLTAGNWASSIIDDSFSGVTLTGALTVYITGANRTTGASGANFNYSGNHNLTITAASASTRRFVLGGNLSFQPTGSAGRVLTFGGAGVTPIEFAAARTFTVGAGHTIVKPSGSGTMIGGGFKLTKDGDGILAIGHGTANNFQLQVDAGTFRYDNFSIMGGNGKTITINQNGTVDLQATYEQYTTTLNINGGILTGSTGQFRSAGSLTSTGGGDVTWTGAGYLQLAGNVAYNVGAPNEALIFTGGELRLGATRTFTVANDAQAIDVDIGATVTGVGFGLIKEGPGVLALSANNSYSGPTTVNAGTLALKGSGAIGASAVTVNAATLAPGGIGVADAANALGSSLTLTSSSTVLFDLGTTSDQIQVAGAVTLAGTLTVADSGGLVAGNYTLMTCSGTPGGAFATPINMPGGFNGSVNTGDGFVELVVTAGASAPEINLRGGDTPQDILDDDMAPTTDDHTDFGSATVADGIGGTVVRTFTIQNLGTGALTLDGSPDLVAVGGTHAADFEVTLNPTTPVGASSETTFQVTFNPSMEGLRTATLTIAHDDDTGDEDPYVFAIQGTGTVPDINLKDPSGDPLPNNGSYDFGSSPPPVPIGPLTFTIENTGGATLTLTSVTTVGGNNTDFVVNTTGMSGTVAASGNTTFTVTFTPGEVGPRSTTLTIVSDDPDAEGTYTVTLDGAGTPPVANLVITDPTEVLGVNSIAFGSWEVGETAGPQNIRVQNNGPGPATVTPTKSGSHPGDFTVTGGEKVIPVSEYRDWTVTFSPTSAGARGASIDFQADENGTPDSCTVSGTGTVPDPGPNSFIWVDPNKASGGAGTFANPYASIEAAYASVWGTAGAHEIKLLPGTFDGGNIGAANYINWTSVGSPTANTITMSAYIPGYTTIAFDPVAAGSTYYDDLVVGVIGLWRPGNITTPQLNVNDVTITVAGGGMLFGSDGPIYTAGVITFGFDNVDLYLNQNANGPSGIATLHYAQSYLDECSIQFSDSVIYSQASDIYAGRTFGGALLPDEFVDGASSSSIYVWSVSEYVQKTDLIGATSQVWQSSRTPNVLQYKQNGATGNNTFLKNFLPCPLLAVTTPPDPSSINFGNVINGQPSGPQTITVQNNGGVSATVTPAKTGTHPADFNIVGGTQVIGVGGTYSWTVTFTPGGFGARGPTTVTFSASEGGTTDTCDLTGTGVTAPGTVFRFR